MATKKLENDDPFTLIGVPITTGAEDALVEMACAFAEEFLRMGWSPDRILQLFRNPFYRGPYAAYQAKGEEWVRALLASARPLPRP
jgi:hypothetical protein